MKRRKRRGGGERFVKLPHWMLKCPAWRTLSPNAKAVLLHLWEEHNGSNNGEIVYAVRSSANIDRRHLTDGQKRDLVHEAEDEDIGIGISKDQTARALTELTRRGFLRVARNSAFTLKTKEARRWTLTAEPVGDKPATKDFMCWSEGATTPQSHQRDRDPATKSKLRSRQRDRQSHQRDRDAENETILPVSVAPARPSTPESPPSRSHQCDSLYIAIPCPDERRAGCTQQLDREGEAKNIRSNFKRAPAEAAAAAPPTLRVIALNGQVREAAAAPAIRDLADYDAAVDATVWNRWLDNIARYAARALKVPAMIEAQEAVEEARRAGKATAPHIRKMLDDLDELDRAERAQQRDRG